MKYLSILFILGFGACTSIKLSVPVVFKQQATEFHVNGARKNRMSFGEYQTSRIRRGAHVFYPGWSRGYFFENLFLNSAGLNKEEVVSKERAKFRYRLSAGEDQLEIYGEEKSTRQSTEFTLLHTTSPIGYERPESYRYIFSSVIKTDTAAHGPQWELVMSNLWERKKDPVKSIFTIVSRDDYGYATDGRDSIFINPVSLQNTESPNGRQGRLPFKMLSGYELSNSEGVVAILDLIGKNVWLYNELGRKERLIIAGITTALFARKVNTQW